MDKTVLSAQDLLEDSFRLGLRILESGFRPTMIIAIWRGGTPVGMAMQEILSYAGLESDHIAIRTSSYIGVDERGAVAVAEEVQRAGVAAIRYTVGIGIPQIIRGVRDRGDRNRIHLEVDRFRCRWVHEREYVRAHRRVRNDSAVEWAVPDHDEREVLSQ